mgnify:CR=1 FL=1
MYLYIGGAASNSTGKFITVVVAHILCYILMLLCISHCYCYIIVEVLRDAQLHRLGKVRAKTLQELFTSASALIDTAIPNLDRYSSGRALNSVGAMEEINSSIQDTVEEEKHLNKFQYALMNEDYRPAFVTWSIDESTLENFVKSKLGCNDEFMDDLVQQLGNLRSIIYSKVDQNLRWDEPTCIQPMMELYVDYVLLKVHQFTNKPRIHVAAANKPQFDIKFTESNVKWTGQTDLYCSLTDVVNIYESVAIIEMKSPFDTNNLYNAKAQQPKQQLLGQAVGCFRSRPDRKKYTLSYLTDVFAISLLCHVQGCAYLSQRVVEPKAFCLRLLIMCCDISDEEWETLFPSEKVPVAVSDEAESSSSSTSYKALSTTKTTENDGDKGKRGTKKAKETKKRGIIGCDKEDERTRKFEDINNMLMWSDQRRNVVPFSVDALLKHNSVVQAGKLSTWK